MQATGFFAVANKLVIPAIKELSSNYSEEILLVAT